MQTTIKFSLLFLMLLTTSVFAQVSDSENYSHLRWEGTVDGKVLLKINRRRVTYDVISGVPVQRHRYDFTDPLPFKNTRVDVNVEEGRGNVRVIEQPRERNDYTAVIEINDSSSGKSDYVLDVYWEKSYGGNTGNNNSNWRNKDDDYFEWQGRVDGESILYIRGEDVRVDDISGNGVTNAKYRSSRPIPSRSMTLNLVETSGRGEITLIEQPDNRNNYTAAVRIHDKQSGTGLYSFALTWSRRGGRNGRDDYQSNNGNSYGGNSNNYSEARRGMVWTGRVDGTDFITVRGDQVSVQHQSGAEISDMNFRFDRRLPNATTSVFVKKIRGRGKVNVIQQPDRSNGFTAIIQVEDKNGGADNYEFEVSW